MKRAQKRTLNEILRATVQILLLSIIVSSIIYFIAVVLLPFDITYRAIFWPGFTVIAVLTSAGKAYYWFGIVRWFGHYLESTESGTGGSSVEHMRRAQSETLLPMLERTRRWALNSPIVHKDTYSLRPY